MYYVGLIFFTTEAKHFLVFYLMTCKLWNLLSWLMAPTIIPDLGGASGTILSSLLHWIFPPPQLVFILKCMHWSVLCWIWERVSLIITSLLTLHTSFLSGILPCEPYPPRLWNPHIHLSFQCAMAWKPF